jgi:hypothetical protein
MVCPVGFFIYINSLKMRTTVIHANLKAANEIATKLLDYKNKNAKPLFTRQEIENGFEIKGKKKIEDVWQDVVVFRYIDDNGRRKFDYDEKLLTFK